MVVLDIEADARAAQLVVGAARVPCWLLRSMAGSVSVEVRPLRCVGRVAPAEPFAARYGRFMTSQATSRPRTLGSLRASGWTSTPVKEEVRRNAVARIAAGEPLFEGVMGYEHTVMLQLENALLAGHDIIFLGERGQAKTRIIRSLTGLLDEWMPIVGGSEINDDPFVPVSRHAVPTLIDRAGRRDARSIGCIATIASARSWQPPTHRSPT